MSKRKKKSSDIKPKVSDKVTKVVLSKGAMKDLDSIPQNIAEVARKWTLSVEAKGTKTVAKEGAKGLHDEPLQGDQAGKRSIRLNRSWRLIYSEEDGKVNVVTVEKITKHDYRKKR